MKTMKARLDDHEAARHNLLEKVKLCVIQKRPLFKIHAKL